jgi:hypothetical protein
VVSAGCFGVMAGFGSLFVSTFAVFVKPLSAEFCWSREAISSGFVIAAVTVGLCSPLLTLDSEDILYKATQSPVSAPPSTHDTALSFKLDSFASRSRSAGTTRVPIASMARMSFA